MTSSMHVLDRTGDTEITWDSDQRTEIDAAREHFAKLKSKGYMAYTVRGDNRTQIHAFDETAERIVMAPPLVGG